MKRNPLKYLPIININYIQQLLHADKKKLGIGAHTLAIRAHLVLRLPSSLGHTCSWCARDVLGTELEK